MIEIPDPDGDTVFVIILLLLTIGLTYGFYVYPYKLSTVDYLAMQRLIERYETVRNLIPSRTEKKVQIEEMYVYPVRGIRAGS